MLLAVLIVQAVVAQPVVTCRVPTDPRPRTWILDRPEARKPDPFADARGAKAEGLPPLAGVPGLRQIAFAGPLAVDCTASQQPHPAAARPASEWIVAAGVARSVHLFQSQGDRRYGVQNVSWGRELTRSLGPGALRGRFTWAAEVMPVFFQTSPSRVYGLGVAPVVWRWNLTPQPRWSAFAELSMGGLWTTAPIPEATRRVNFTAHWGGGVRLGSSPRHALVLGYRFQHISNGNQLLSNPGVNSHVLLLGWSARR